jgi:hypothetical protein
MDKTEWFAWTTAAEVKYTVRLADIVAIEERPNMGGTQVIVRGWSMPLEIDRTEVQRLKAALGIRG